MDRLKGGGKKAG